MTAKEKARQLVQKYFDEVGDWMTWEQAKSCAIIAVDEILLDKKVGYSKDIIEEKKYWQQVKQEINSL